MPSQPARRSAGVAPGTSGVLTIGEVLRELSGEFPQVTASKIRFLEEKGLIAPQRTRAGYRKYTGHDVERLRFVLALQRDQYLPLKVIKDYVDAIDRGERPESLPGGMTLAPRIVSEQLSRELSAHARRLTAETLAAEAGAPRRLVDDLVSFGLISAVDNRFDEYALKITTACVQLELHGIEPRHLRPFRAAADRELGLVERVVAPVASRKDVASKARAAETAREISELCLGLHSALVNSHIARMDS
ncbi:MerR family transcriptional regulator [Arthrobacter sp. Leaf234]|uniref:transcriptional regulator FtsR n=1 Tax=Arthrobacter sp. Leaf234 TaxID=1736303 RepID=UPI0006F22E69|nr:MerR family transcriptional regulator [Arthrobacter sp. Leaf234]KQN95665.1 MerR family transcriptional regulator [Arthrobacter sp. Leaf234]